MSSVAGPPLPAPLGPEVAALRAASAPAWLAGLRRSAWEQYEQLPFPSSARDEDWRRTDISSLHVERFSPATAVDERLITAMQRQRDRAVPDAAFAVDGPVAPAIRDADTLLAQGIIVTTLEDAAARHAELTQQALSAASREGSKFNALWNAMWRGGVFIHVPAGVDALVPVWIAHPASQPDTGVFPTTVVQLERGAALTVIDVFASPPGDTPIFSDAVAALAVGADARLTYIAIQQWGDGVWHVARQRAVLQANARLQFFGASLGSRLQKAYWDVRLEGPGAEADIAGVCFGDGTQHLDHQSLQEHVAPETRSNLLLKVAVRDKARSVYSGLIDVAPEAVHADGYVQNRNLILSRGAKADSVPRLEIRANDVRCGHGATAGHIDDEQRFYCMSRGIDAVETDRLIVRAFLNDALAKVPHEGVRKHLGDLLDEEIAGRTQAGLDEARL
jgi:Fe-S cluster assembly protein SufD